MDEFIDLLDPDSGLSIDDSAVFKARHNLAYSAFQDMNQKSLDFWFDHGSVKLWHDYQIIDVDGSTLRLPNTEDILDCYDPNKDSKGNPQGPPLARLNLLYDPLNQLCLSAKLDNLRVSELNQLVDQNWFWKSGQLVIADRHYDAFWLFAWLLERKVDFCIRLKKDQRRQVIKDFLMEGCSEKIVTVTPGRGARKKCRLHSVATDPITLRLIRVQLPSGEIEILATSVLDQKKIKFTDFGDLYHLRWPIEEKIKQLKFRVNIENWTGKSPFTVLQDVYAKLFGCNLMVWMANGLETEIEERSEKRSYDCQINWAHALSSFNRFLPRLFFGRALHTNLNRLHDLFMKCLSPIRPNRKYDRKHKSHKREFFMCYKFCC